MMAADVSRRKGRHKARSNLKSDKKEPAAELL